MKLLETERLSLRLVEPSDAAFLFGLMNEPGWLAHIGDRGIRTVEDARAFAQNRLIQAHHDFGFTLYLTELKPDTTPVGLCGLVKRDGLDDVDLGYAIGAAHAGRGYATEACTAMMAHARDRLGLARLVAIVQPKNAASTRVLEKLGFRFEGMVKLAGETVDLKLFGVDT